MKVVPAESDKESDFHTESYDFNVETSMPLRIYCLADPHRAAITGLFRTAAFPSVAAVALGPC